MFATRFKTVRFTFQEYNQTFFKYFCYPVFTDFENKQAWKKCFSVSGVRLPTGYYFGMTAVTGDLSDNHDILGVRFYELDSDVVSNFWFYRRRFRLERVEEFKV